MSSMFALSHTQPPTSSIRLRCTCGHERIKLNTYKDFVGSWLSRARVQTLLTVSASWAISNGNMLARDGKTVMDNVNAGQEWQVLDSELASSRPLRLLSTQ
jgi:hypothetical protein